MTNKFLSKLVKEGKIKFVESSEEIKKSYLNKSESNLDSAKILLKNDKLEESVSLVYYSMYSSIIALFFKIGIKCENHSATIIILKEIFGINNSDISFAKKERIDKQYYADFNVTELEVKESLKIAEEFNAKVLDFIIKLNNSDVEKYKLKFKELIGGKINL
ncbi:DNA-binding protein [Candidatus Pacearchaeota archaeon CG10_big_fil_rev_8_21_14_0_10_30_48]|nr:MAG: DNA-binding protein [Candidatus Pacearchaeota archaeon CG10_big_fil_rev_8_21_14_0_10_30_48]